MAATEMMNIDERFKFLRMMKGQYLGSDRQTKRALLTVMQKVTEQHRKHLIAVIADTLDWICAKRLTPVLAETARHLAKFNELELSEGLIAQLERISVAPVRRILKRIGRPKRPTAQVLIPVR